MLKKLKLNVSMKTYKTFLNQHQKNDVLFIIGDWNAKVGSQEISGLTGKFGHGVQKSRAQANRDLPREHTGQSKHPLPTKQTQEKSLHMDITRWSVLKSD